MSEKVVRWMYASSGMLGLLIGCAEPMSFEEMMRKPSPPPELKKLERMTGSWTTTSEMVSPCPEEMKKMMGEAGKDMPSTMKGASKAEWVLGGMALKETGWFEMGKDLKANYEAYWTWDAKKKKFRTTFMSDWGEYSEGWGTPCGSGCDGFCMKGTAVDAHGNKSQQEGCLKFVDNDTVDWSFCMKTGLFQKMSMKGTSKRQR